MRRTNKSLIYLMLILLFSIGIISVLVVGLRARPVEAAALPAEAADAQPEIKEVERIVEVEKLVTVEKEITSEMIREGLQDMGTLITGEYDFTEVISFSSVKKLFNTDFQLPFTESNYLASYDGAVTAGIDFSDIAVFKDETAGTITVTMPKAEIQAVDIDPNSFVLYSERNGFGNPISAEDFNLSLIELENTARAKALDHGLLDRANEHAKTLAENFVRSLADTTRYTLIFN